MRRVLHTALLALLVSSLVVLSPSVSVAVERSVPVRSERITITLNRTRTVAFEEPAQHVALYWRGHPDAAVSVAFSDPADGFGTRVDAGRDPVGELRHDATTYGAVLDADGAAAVRVFSDEPIAHLTVLAMRDGAAHESTVARIGQVAMATTDQPPVTSRAQWGADESLRSGTPSFVRVQKLIVHHTATSNGYTSRAEAESQIRAILRYHTVTQGWSDIGYNFLVDKFGNVYEGRWSRDYGGASPTGDNAAGEGVVGAHTGGWNSGTLGVAMLGTYTNRDVTPAARRSLEQLLAWAAARNDIDPQATQRFTNPSSGESITTPNIAGHRDYKSTECPGGTFYATLPQLRAAVAARTAPAGADTAAPSVPTGLAAETRRHRVSLSWSASVDDSGADPGYRVLRAGSADGVFRRIATVAAPAYVDTGLQRRRSYYYKVRAFDTAGNVSVASATLRARTR